MNPFNFFIAIGIGIAIGVVLAGRLHGWAAEQETSHSVCWPRPAHTLTGRRG